MAPPQIHPNRPLQPLPHNRRPQLPRPSRNDTSEIPPTSNHGAHLSRTLAHRGRRLRQPREDISPLHPHNRNSASDLADFHASTHVSLRFIQHPRRSSHAPSGERDRAQQILLPYSSPPTFPFTSGSLTSTSGIPIKLPDLLETLNEEDNGFLPRCDAQRETSRGKGIFPLRDDKGHLREVGDG